MVSFIPSCDVGSLFLPLADPMLAGPPIPLRGMLISTFFSSTVDPMLAEASLPTAHGSSHGYSAPSTIFTPGGSLATDSYLISGPGPSTVTQDEPIDEVMMPEKSDGPDSYCYSCILV